MSAWANTNAKEGGNEARDQVWIEESVGLTLARRGKGSRQGDHMDLWARLPCLVSTVPHTNPGRACVYGG
jgi:hypothetical protein